MKKENKADKIKKIKDLVGEKRYCSFMRSIGYELTKTNRPDYFNVSNGKKSFGIHHKSDFIKIAVENNYYANEAMNEFYQPKGYFDPQDMRITNKDGLDIIHVKLKGD